MPELTKEDFLARIETAVNRPLLDVEKDILSIGEQKVDMSRLQLRLDAGFIDTTRGYITEFIDVCDVATRLAEKRIGYWLYDRATKMWVINMERGAHTVFAGALHTILSGGDIVMASSDEDAEKYILEHRGFYVSGAMNMYIPIKDEKMRFTPEEEVFELARGTLGWRGI